VSIQEAGRIVEVEGIAPQPAVEAPGAARGAAVHQGPGPGPEKTLGPVGGGEDLEDGHGVVRGRSYYPHKAQTQIRAAASGGRAFGTVAVHGVSSLCLVLASAIKFQTVSPIGSEVK
jgi:hypothetical protein